MSFFIQSGDDEGSRKSEEEDDDKKRSDGTVYDPSLVPGNLAAKSSSVINFYPEWCKCFGSAGIRYPHGEGVTFRDLVRYFFQCPPHGAFARIVVFLMVFGLSWAILYLLIGPVAGLKGPIIALIILEISGLFSGMMVKMFGLPSLLAPLVIGIVLRNVQPLDIFDNFKFPYGPEYCDEHFGRRNLTPANLTLCCIKGGLHSQGAWITPIREIALTMILTRAGLELSPKQLKKLKGAVPALAFLPCVVEALTAAALFYVMYLQLEPSFMMCLVAGFALAAVSPAVVVPGMLSLAKKGYGIAKGVPTLLIASSSIDDVLAISLFSLFLSIATVVDNPDIKNFCNEHNGPDHLVVSREWEYAGGPVGICIGFIHGVLLGCVLHFLPSRDMGSKSTIRLLVLLAINITSMLGYAKTEFLSSAGSVGVLVTSFVASFGWRSQPHWKPVMHEIEHKLAHLWTLCVPILFGTIGKEMKFVADPDDDYFDAPMRNMTAYKSLGHPFSGLNILKLFGTIFFCLLIRSIVAYSVVSFAGLNHKERFFVAMAWIPKATVQAALAPLVITTVIDKGIDDLSRRWLAMNTVALAVFGILLTAPAGAIAIAFAGPRLLSKIQPHEVEEEFPNGEGEEPSGEDLPVIAVPSRRESTWEALNESARRASAWSSAATSPRRPSSPTGMRTINPPNQNDKKPTPPAAKRPDSPGSGTSSTTSTQSTWRSLESQTEK